MDIKSAGRKVWSRKTDKSRSGNTGATGHTREMATFLCKDIRP